MASNSDKRSEKLERGTIYRKTKGGNYFFRYQVNGRRQALSLRTKNIDEPRRSRDGLPRQQWSEAEWQFMMAL